MAPKKAKKEKQDKEELTSEEKKTRADMMALKAEEAFKRKEEVAKAHLLQLQKLEEQYSKENLQKIHDHWRRIMRAAKVDELHKETQQLSEFYQYEMQHRDVMISKRMQQLEEAEQQRHMAFSKHLQIVDGLIDMHHIRMKVPETGSCYGNLNISNLDNF
eukprot:c43394_g1_i1 orf=441-920(+)